MDASPCTVRPLLNSSGDGGPKISSARLWPQIPASNLLSAFAPYSGFFSNECCEGSIEGQGGTHSGFTPVDFSVISAMCPPSTVTVTRSSEFSILTVLRLIGLMVASIILRALVLGVLGAAHGFQARQRRVGFREIVKIARYLFDRRDDIVHVTVLTDQQELRKPHGFVIGGAFGDWAMHDGVIHGIVTAHG